jgi:hypothetical protein
VTQTVRSSKAIVCVATLLAIAVSAASAQQAPKIKVASETDLPRFSYPLTGSASGLLTSDDATFNGFMNQFATDVNSLLANYDIQDKTTLRGLLYDLENIAQLNGDISSAYATDQRLGTMMEKPDDKALFGLYDYPFLKAWKQTGARTGPAFERPISKTSLAASTLFPSSSFRMISRIWSRAASSPIPPPRSRAWRRTSIPKSQSPTRSPFTKPQA